MWMNKAKKCLYKLQCTFAYFSSKFYENLLNKHYKKNKPFRSEYDRISCCILTMNRILYLMLLYTFDVRRP